MRNIRAILFVSALTLAVLACGFGSAPALPSTDNVATIVASTLQALTPAAPAATATTEAQVPQGVPVKYQNVSFTIPTGLATDAAPQTIPAMTDDNGGPWGAGPQHIEFRIDGLDVPANSFSVSHIDVYPAQEYANANSGANISLQRLQGLLSNPSAPLNNQTLPRVPSFNAASMISAQIKRLDFQNGHGVRVVTQYGQAVGPIANNGTFYSFHGLTNDGKYFIIAVLPVQAPFLQNGNDPNAGLPPGGIPFPGYYSTDTKVFDDYYSAVTDKLNATAPDQFSPSLTALDALVQSFMVSP